MCRVPEGLAGLRADAPSISSTASAAGMEGPEGLAAVLVGGGRAWPGFETTRRATLAARTASGRAAAQQHTQRLSPEAGPDGARNNSGATSNTAQGRGPAGPRP